MMQRKLVVLGFLSHFPVAGVAWQTVHYLVGFRRLGFDVYYVENHGCTPSKLMQDEQDDGAIRAAAYIERILRAFDLAGQWAYVSRDRQPRVFGMSDTRLREVLRSAEFIFNLHGSHLPVEELAATGRLVYVGTDPVDVETEVHQKRKQTLDYLAAHHAHFTFGENLGRPDCLVPRPDPFLFRPTRQPVVLDFWEGHGAGPGDAFTTVGNWRQPGRKVNLDGETYRWSKHLEFLKFIDLPARAGQPFELALSSYTGEDRQLLERRGWKVRDALEVSRDIDVYRRYIAGSRGEFTVAKDQNVRLRSGWFSDRAATYLAAGRPVITQETGFSNILPVGAGLFAFSGMEEILAATESIQRDYEWHRRHALALARECFSHEVVLGDMLDSLGVGRTPPKPAPSAGAGLLGGDCDIMPVSRWPTRIPEETLSRALRLEPVAVPPAPACPGPRVSVIVATRNGDAFTRMCVASLLGAGWREGDELIVIDNDSSDGTREFLAGLSHRNDFVRLVLNDRNAGFAAANNQGLAMARGDVMVLLNNDTIVPEGWLGRLLVHLEDPRVGLVGPVTNHTCNEAQVDAPYRTFDGFREHARMLASVRAGQSMDIPMLAMFCVAMRRWVFEQAGPLDEQFGMGLFEDDDYSRRVRNAGLRTVCAEDVFIHHFGQAAFGELCAGGAYDRLLEENRRRFERKWGEAWKPHGRRLDGEYLALRARAARLISAHAPPGAVVLVVSKGDDAMLDVNGRTCRHFPCTPDGAYANQYPADSAEAVAHLEAQRQLGAGFLFIPETSAWWLDFYGGLKEFLDRDARLAAREDGTGWLFDLRDPHG